MMTQLVIIYLFFFNDTATTEIYTLSLYDALPIFAPTLGLLIAFRVLQGAVAGPMIPLSQALLLSSYPKAKAGTADRKSTRLNSSHMSISYAVFCLKKKKI